jgi:hypothetical protein
MHTDRNNRDSLWFALAAGLVSLTVVAFMLAAFTAMPTPATPAPVIVAPAQTVGVTP